MLGNKKFGLLVAAVMMLALVLVACAPQTVETIVEVTRVVTETEVVEGETVEVTRVVTEQVEVVVTPEPEVMGRDNCPGSDDVCWDAVWRHRHPGSGVGLRYGQRRGCGSV